MNRLYTNIAAIQVLLEALGHKEKIGDEVETMFSMYPTAWRFHSSMGIPVGWKQEPLLFTQSTTQSPASGSNRSSSATLTKLKALFQKVINRLIK